MDDFGDLGAMHFDLLREVGNIGAGNAVTSLAKLLGHKVEMTVPAVNLVEFKDIANCLGGPESIVVGVLIQIYEDVQGFMMFLLPKESADTVLTAMMADYAPPAPAGEPYTPMQISALIEMGNILSSSYLGSLSMLTSLTMLPQPPLLSIDMANAILSVPMIEFGKVADKALFIESVFETGVGGISGFFLLIPDMPSFARILKSLGVG
ncbi:MAG: chemotaxis protein CheC [Clostridiales bacterium]|jgi:chemotaxis protein CheC|nr:chemotaxis protein CheC [Clostridiales bacterium]MDR2752558.1 chemotaxis protein CheC [Clostridiales bacterium]